MACDLGRGWERASDRVACQASRRAEPACVCLPRERVPCGVRACRARRWCAAAPATTDRNARAGPCRMLGPGAQRRPPVIVYTCFEKSSRSPYCTREPRRRAHCVILIYHDFSETGKDFFVASCCHDSRAPRGRGAARASGSCMVAWRPSRLASAVLVDAVARLTLRWSVSASTRRRARCRRGPCGVHPCHAGIRDRLCRPRPHCAHNKRLYGFIIYRSPRTPQARPLHLFGLLSRAGCTKTYPRVFT